MAKYIGKVAYIVDGDTFDVVDKNKQKQRIRIFGIDTPEKRQEFGLTAKEFTRELLEDKYVEVDTVALGQYNRVVAIVKVNGQSVAEELLKAGLAFASGSNHRLANHYFSLQEQAKSRNVGLWKSEKAENPSVFRRRLSREKLRNNPLYAKSTPDYTDEPKRESQRNSKPSLLDHLKSLIERTGDLIDKNFSKPDEKPKVNDDPNSIDKIDGDVLLDRYLKKKQQGKKMNP